MRSKSSPKKHAFAKKLRANLTRPEKILWKRLCSKKLGVWFYSQSLMYGYIVDFWCPSAGIAVEVDGKSHRGRKAYDSKRDAVLLKKGIITMRFTNTAVRRNPAAVAALIRAKVVQRLK